MARFALKEAGHEPCGAYIRNYYRVQILLLDYARLTKSDAKLYFEKFLKWMYGLGALLLLVYLLW